MNAAFRQIEQKLHRSTVLIVEDDAVIRRPLAEYLQAVGYRVVEAASAADATALLTAGMRVDVMFSDIRMPGTMDGLGLARWIHCHHPAIRLMLTSGGNANAARAAKAAEIFIPKPYQAAHVAARIDQLLAPAPTRSVAPASAPSTVSAPTRHSVPASARSREPGGDREESGG